MKKNNRNNRNSKDIQRGRSRIGRTTEIRTQLRRKQSHYNISVSYVRAISYIIQLDESEIDLIVSSSKKIGSSNI